MRAPILHRLVAVGRRTMIVIVALLAVGALVELARIFVILSRWHRIAGYVFLGILALAFLTALIRWLLWVSSSHQLDPPDMPADGARSHADLMACNRFLIARLKRMSRNMLLSEEQQHHLLEAAYRIEEIVGHHPLNDDLQRSLQRTIDETYEPACSVLRKRAEVHARERMRAVVNDVVAPAFPASTPLLVYSYQFILVSRIVDIYLPGATLLEYGRVLRDVADVVTRGCFLKLGQTLFAGVYSNSPPLGRAADTLGHAIISIWLTRTVSKAAILRCEDLRAWSTARAVADLDACVLDMLADSKECLVEEVLPVLKQAIRHNVPPGVADAAGFSSGVIDGLVRAVDAALKAHKAQPPEVAVAAVRKTMTGEQAEPAPDAPEDRRHEPARMRRRRRRHHSGIWRVLFVFSQRIKYTIRRPG